MAIMDDVKTLTNSSDESLLTILIDQCKSYATDYCNLSEYDSNLDNVVCQMCVERFNKRYSEGVNTKTYSGLQENYTTDFAPSIYTQLKRFRKLRTVSSNV